MVFVVVLRYEISFVIVLCHKIIPILWHNWFSPLYYHIKKLFSFVYYDTKLIFVPVLWHKIDFRTCIVTRNCPYSMTQNWFSSLYCDTKLFLYYHTKLVFIPVLWHKLSLYYHTKLVFVCVLTHEIVPILWHKISFCPCTMTTKLVFSPFRFCIVTRNCLYYYTKWVFIPVLWHEIVPILWIKIGFYLCTCIWNCSYTMTQN